MKDLIIAIALIIIKILIGKICGAIRILYKPIGIRREAKAEADALTTKEMQTTGLDKDDLKFLKRKITLTRLKDK